MQLILTTIIILYSMAFTRLLHCIIYLLPIMCKLPLRFSTTRKMHFFATSPRKMLVLMIIFYTIYANFKSVFFSVEDQTPLRFRIKNTYLYYCSNRAHNNNRYLSNHIYKKEEKRT